MDISPLLNTPLFSGIGAQQLSDVLACLRAEIKHYKKGEYILLEGSPADHIGIVLQGTAQVVNEDFNGNRTLVTELWTGDLFCETFACAQVPAIPVSVVSVSDTIILFFVYSTLTTVCSMACKFHSTLLQNMMAILAQKNLGLASKVRHITKRSIREKLLSYLTEQAQIAGKSSFSIPFNRQELADYLSVDRSALSAELSRMQNEKILTYQRNNFELLSFSEI